MPLRIVHVNAKHVGDGTAFRWSAIFSGAFLMLGVGIAFLLLGDAIGLSVHNATNPGIHGALKFWSWLYTAATLVFSYFCGSLMSTRSRDIDGLAAGSLHGLVSWGMATSFVLAIAVFVSAGARGVLAGAGTDNANWLAITVIAGGFIFSAIGGMLGKKGIEYRRMEREELVSTPGQVSGTATTSTVNKTEAA